MFDTQYKIRHNSGIYSVGHYSYGIWFVIKFYTDKNRALKLCYQLRTGQRTPRQFYNGSLVAFTKLFPHLQYPE
jgi:hypothetical protein